VLLPSIVAAALIVAALMVRDVLLPTVIVSDKTSAPFQVAVSAFPLHAAAAASSATSCAVLTSKFSLFRSSQLCCACTVISNSRAADQVIHRCHDMLLFGLSPANSEFGYQKEYSFSDELYCSFLWGPVWAC
jgi:hypothetical protein